MGKGQREAEWAGDWERGEEAGPARLCCRPELFSHCATVCTYH